MACRIEVAFAEEDGQYVDAARAALDEADRVESLLTVFRQSSEISRINREAADGPVVADTEMFTLLQRCARLQSETEGAFDVTTTPLSRCWGFLQRDGRMPDVQAIAAARERVGMHRVLLDAADSSIRFASPGVELNLGAIGKGYAIDRMAAVLRARNVAHALVSAGGSSAAALGGRGRGWPIDLTSVAADRADHAGAADHAVAADHPDDADRPRRTFARVYLRDAALGTSGAGEQFIMVDGMRYGHVIDPRTGWPSRGVLSATVITREAAEADALSTAFLIGGEELARRYCESHPGTLVVLLPDDGAGRPRVIGDFPGAHVETIR